jgi:hypothetical protein
MRALLLLAIIATHAVIAETATTITPSNGLELEPLIIRSFDGDQLILLITNRGEGEQRMLTRGYGLTVDSTKPEATRVELRFRFEELSYEDRKWTVVSPIGALAPAPIRAGESAQIAIALDADAALALERPGSSLELSYVVEPEIGERYGVWQGELSFSRAVKPVRISESLATTAVSADATSKALAAAELAPDVRLLAIGDDVVARPGRNSSLRGRVAGRFLGVKGGYVRIGPRQVKLTDIRPEDREVFELYKRFNP